MSSKVGRYYCSSVLVCHREGEESGGYLKTSLLQQVSHTTFKNY